MRKIICPGCQTEIRIEGIGALCPHCGTLVVASNLQPDEPAQSPLPPTAPVNQVEYELPGSPPPAEPEPAPAAEPAGAIAEPTEADASEEGLEELPEEVEPQDIGPAFPVYYYVIGCLVAAITIVLATLIILLVTRTPPPTVVVVPSTAPATAPAPPQVEAPPATAPVEVLAFAPEPAPASRPAIAVPYAALASLSPREPLPTPNRVTDEQIGQAIGRGLTFLKAQFAETRLKSPERYDPELFAGLNALAIYALLHANQAAGNAQVNLQGDLVKGLLDRLPDFPMTGPLATYSRSLRISAMCVLNRPQDHPTIEADLQWLLKSSMSGAFTYQMPSPGRTRAQGQWDSSNSHYGALGVWAAAEAGYTVPTTFWNDVEQHWTAAQTVSGGWGYGPVNPVPTLSMTAAGTTILFVARDQLNLSTDTQLVAPGGQPLSKVLEHAIEWLGEGDHVINLPGVRNGYVLFAIERAGLASGNKYFGQHDWYLELAGQLVRQQGNDGSWNGTDGPVAETAFDLLFLSRGRHPVLLCKLSYDGAWNNRPRDVSGLSRFASYQLERPVNWEVADIRRSWWEWADAPLLLITSNKAADFSDAQLEKLRAFAEGGGLILLNRERESEEFDRFASDLALRLFPDYSLKELGLDHPVYSVVFPMTDKPKLMGVSNGARLLLAYSPTDLAARWSARPPKAARTGSEMAVNLAVYAAGLRDLQNRVVSSFVGQPSMLPIGTVPLARLQYDGNWDPEPGAWPRMNNVMQVQTGFAIRAIPTKPAELDFQKTPIATLTGVEALNLNDVDVASIRKFVTRGGVLLIDSCGGSKAFADSIEAQLLPKLSAGSPGVLSAQHPILVGTSKGMSPLAQPLVRPAVPKASAQIRGVRVGAGLVLVTRLDLTMGLLGTNTFGVNGFDPGYSQDFVKNVILWTLAHLGDAEMIDTAIAEAPQNAPTTQP